MSARTPPTSPPSARTGTATGTGTGTATVAAILAAVVAVAAVWLSSSMDTREPPTAASRPAPRTLAQVSPHAWVVDGVLSAEECARVLAASRSWAWTPDPTSHAGGEQATVPASQLPGGLAAKLARLLHIGNAPSHLTFTRAPRGSSRDAHHDTRGGVDLTAVLFFQDLETGWVTMPLAGARVRPKPGRALVFANRLADGSPDPLALHGTQTFDEDAVHGGGYRLTLPIAARLLHDRERHVALGWLADAASHGDGELGGNASVHAEWYRAGVSTPYPTGPTTGMPTLSPSVSPSAAPSTSKPTSQSPTSTSRPSRAPTSASPSRAPTSASPSRAPTSASPSRAPTKRPSSPTPRPTWRSPTSQSPTVRPTRKPATPAPTSAVPASPPAACLTYNGMPQAACMMLRAKWLLGQCGPVPSAAASNPVVWVGFGCPSPCSGRANCGQVRQGGCKLWSDCAIGCASVCARQPFCRFMSGVCTQRVL